MSEDERVRWDDRYATGDYRPHPNPSPFLEAALGVVPPGRALVLACGTGRNALRLAEAGFAVEALDISSVALERARAEAKRRRVEVEWRAADLDHVDLDPGRYHLITMIRYVNRTLWPTVIAAIAGNGWLLVEQHLRTPLDVGGPGDDFRLAPGELLAAFSELRIVTYDEGLHPADGPGQRVALTRLLACKGDPGW
jgi:SAM-dependent methyltransferase